jgi:hypothetical protein
MTVQLRTRPPSRLGCRVDLPALRDRPQQPSLFDAGRGHPGVDALLDPDRDGHGADAPALALEVGQHPPSLPLLNGLDVKLGQLVPPEGAADQKRQDHGVALALEGRAVGDGQKFFGLLPGQPVPQPSSLLPDVGDIGQARRLLRSDQVVPPGLADQLAHRREPDINSRGGEHPRQGFASDCHRCPCPYPALALEVGQDSSSLPLLDGLDPKLGQLLPPLGAVNQKRHRDVVALAFQATPQLGRVGGEGVRNTVKRVFCSIAPNAGKGELGRRRSQPSVTIQHESLPGVR